MSVWSMRPSALRPVDMYWNVGLVPTTPFEPCFAHLRRDVDETFQHRDG